MVKKLKLDSKIVTGSLVFALGMAGIGVNAAFNNRVQADDTTSSSVVVDGSENHYQQQPKGSTVEYGGLKYSVLSKYAAQNHETVGWEMRMLVGTKSSQVGIFTDQLQPGQYFYTGSTPNHNVLTDKEWQKAISQQGTYGDLTVRIGTRYLNDKDKNGTDLQTGTLKYIAPEYLSGINLDDKLAKAGTLSDSSKSSTITADSDDSALVKSGYKQGDTSNTKVDTSQLQQLMSLVKLQAETAEDTSGTDTENTWSPSGSTGESSDSSSSSSAQSSTDYSKITNIGVKEGPNGFYTYDASKKQLKFVVYNLQRVKADSDIIASVIKSMGGKNKVESASPSDVAAAAQKAGAPSDVVSSIDGADTLVVSDDSSLLALNFTNLYMHEIRVMVPVAVEAGNVIPNQYDFGGLTWDGKTIGSAPKFEVSDKPKVIVPGTKEKPADPDKPYKNVLVGKSLTLMNGYNWYGKASDDKINADDASDSKSAEASFSAGSPLTFSKTGTYTVKEKSTFAPGVYIVRTLDGTDINAAVDGTVVKNGELVSVSVGSELKILSGSGKFQLIDATSAFAKVASAQAVANVDKGKTSKVVASDKVKGKDASIDALLSQASTGKTQWTWVVSQPVAKNLRSVNNVDVKLIDDLAQDSLVSLKIVDSKEPTKVIADVTDEAKKELAANDKTVADALASGKSADGIKDEDGLQLSKNLLVYRLKDYTEAKYGSTVSFAITVSGSSNTAHKDTASTQLFNNGTAVTKDPQSTNTVKVVTSQEKEVQPTNPVQPTVTQNPSNPGTPSTGTTLYSPATGSEVSRVNTPVSEALGDVANNSSTPSAVQSLAATGAYLASNLWFLILFPIAVAGSIVEGVYKKRTGRWLTLRELKRLYHARFN